MKNANVNADMRRAIYDLKGRYRYSVQNNPDLIPMVVILCEGEQYEISIRHPLTINYDGYMVVDIKHPEFNIIDWRYYGDESGKEALVIKASDMNVEKKITAFTKSPIIAENIMNLIDMFFLGSDKTIYR